MAGDWLAEADLNAGSEPVSARRSLTAFAALLATLVLLLIGAVALGDRLRPPTGRVPAATFAARQGIALPPDPAAPPTAAMPPAAATVGGVCAAPDCRASATRGANFPAPTGVSAGVVNQPSDSPTARDAVAAYLRAWDAWAQACLALDPAPLELVFAPPELDRARAYVRQLRASGRVLQLDAAHRVTVLELDGDTALLLDELTDRSLYLDPATRRPLSSGAQPTPVGTERVYCRLLRTESGWRVSELVWGR